MQQNKHLDIGVEPSESSTTPQSLAEILQNLLLTDRVGYILFTSGSGSGHIHFRYNQILHATTNGINGEDALLLMLKWPEGTYTLHEDTSPVARSIHSPLENLLLEAARRIDQQSKYAERPPAPQPLPPQAIAAAAAGALPKITIQEPNMPSRTIELVQDYLHLGRHPSNELVFDDSSISGRHCVFMVSGHEVTLRDLNSTNGTFVNDEPISEKVMQVGDVVRIGNIILRFESKPKRPKLQAVDKSYHTEVIALRKKNQLRSGVVPTPSQAIRIDPVVSAAPQHSPEQRKNIMVGVAVIIIFSIALLAFFKFGR